MRPKFKIKNVPETKDLKGGGSCEGPAVPAAGLELGLDISTVDTKLNERIVFVNDEFYKVHQKTKELEAIIEVNRKERREDIEKTFDRERSNTCRKIN